MFKHFSIAFAFLAFTGVSAQAALYTGPAGSFVADTWNTNANWDGGAGSVPSGLENVEIESGRIPWAVNLTPAYTGDLLLRTNATLGLGPATGNATTNALGTGTITMETGSQIIMRYGGTYTFTQNIVLDGDASIRLSESSNGHNVARTFTNAITGSHGFTLFGQNGNTANLDANNDFTELQALDGGANRWRVLANATGSLGEGNVTMGESASLIIAATDAMSASAELYLDGGGATTKFGGFTNKLVLNEDLVAWDVLVGGASLGPGVYNSSSGLLDQTGDPLIGGTGTLTVLIPEPASLLLLGVGSTLILARRKHSSFLP